MNEVQIKDMDHLLLLFLPLLQQSTHREGGRERERGDLILHFKTTVITIIDFIGVHLLLSTFSSQVFVVALDTTF